MAEAHHGVVIGDDKIDSETFGGRMKKLFQMSLVLMISAILFSCDLTTGSSNSNNDNTNSTGTTDSTDNTGAVLDVESTLWNNIDFSSKYFTCEPGNVNSPMDIFDSLTDTIEVYEESNVITENYWITSTYANTINEENLSSISDTFPFFEVDTFDFNGEEYEVLSFNNGNISYSYFENGSLSDFRLSYPDSYLLAGDNITLLDKEKNQDDSNIIAEKFNISFNDDTLIIESKEIRVLGNEYGNPAPTTWQCTRDIDKYIRFTAPQ